MLEKINKNFKITNNRSLFKNYSFKCNENWTLTPKLDSSKVGTKQCIFGALQLENPATTNSEYTSSITDINQFINSFEI